MRTIMATLLERAMPVYHFNEVHRRWIPAEPEKVWDALAQLRLDQLRLTRPLVALRHLGNPMPSSRPLITDGPIQIVEWVPPRFALGATIGRPWRFKPDRHEVATLAEFNEFDEPGWTKYLTDFRVDAGDGGTWLSTETRGHSTDAAARRRFALYWGVIRVGSGLVRRDILATVSREVVKSRTAAT
jgi:hypothetical protein